MSFSNSIKSYTPGYVSNAIASVGWPTIISTIVIFIIFTVIVVMIYRQQIASLFTTGYKENGEHKQSGTGPNSANKDAELMLFYVDWCPHCKTAKPEWDQVKAEYEGKSINGYNLIFTEINCTNESPEIENIIKKYKIEGYPTIKLIKDGQIIEYDAKPSKAMIIQFLNTVL